MGERLGAAVCGRLGGGPASALFAHLFCMIICLGVDMHVSFQPRKKKEDKSCNSETSNTLLCGSTVIDHR